MPYFELINIVWNISMKGLLKYLESNKVKRLIGCHCHLLKTVYCFPQFILELNDYDNKYKDMFVACDKSRSTKILITVQ